MVAARIPGFLQKMAGKIPAGPLSQARIALAQADGAARSGEIETIAALSAELQALLKRFNALVQVGTKQALGREQAERKLVAAQPPALGEAAAPPFAAGAAALPAAVEEGKLEMDAARARLAALRGQAERVLRLDALRAKGRRTSAAAGPVGSAVGALEQALAGRDLAGIRRSAQALREALGWRAWLNRPAVRFGVPALLVLLIVAGLALRPRGAAVTHSVVLQFEPRPAAAAKIVLASASGAAERRTVEQGTESLEVDLRPGRYDVFVDGGFTGIAVVVPGASPVTVPARR